MNFLSKYAIPGLSLDYLFNFIGRKAEEDPMRSPFGYSGEERGQSYAAREAISNIKNLALTAATGYQVYKGAKNLFASQPGAQSDQPPSSPNVPIAPPPEAPPQNPLQSILTPEVLQSLSPETAEKVQNRVRALEKLQANPTADTARQSETILSNIRNLVGETPRQPQEVAPQQAKKGLIDEERERLQRAYPEEPRMGQRSAPQPVPPRQLKPFTNVPQDVANSFNRALALAVNSTNQKPLRFRTEEGGYSSDLASIKKPSKSQTDSIFKRIVQADPAVAESLNKLSAPARRVARNQLVSNFLDQVKGQPTPAKEQKVEAARDHVQRLTSARKAVDLEKEREWLELPAAVAAGTNLDLLLKVIREEL